MQVDMQTHQLKGMEALIRWNCPTRGLVRPAEFIRAAEESGRFRTPPPSSTLSETTGITPDS